MANSQPPTGLLRIQQSDGDTQFAEEIRATLRRRLILIAALLSGTLALLLFDLVFIPERHTRNVETDLFSTIVTLAIYLGPLFLLVKRPTCTLASLRAIEALFLVCIAVSFAVGQYRWYHSDWFQPLIPLAKVEQWKLFSLVGQSFSFPWFLLIVLYGVCIPNTARRTAMAVGSLAAAALALTSLLIWEDVTWRGFLWTEVVPVLLVWLVLGSAIAIYGSHRIRSLQKQALASRKLGQYVLKRVLGTGGMGEVYLAEHRLLKRPCAVKLIRAEKAGDQRNLARFQLEVQAIVKLNHPNVVQVYDYGYAEDGTFYYVMEYLDGMDLEQIVRRHGPLPPERMVHLLRQVAGALQEAHACGLVHRDIKPANIIVCNRGGVHDVAKLVDFGIVRDQDPDEELASLTQTGIVVGSPLYMSPEQIKGSDQLDGRSDLYSLGLVAYFLLTGTNPFRRPSPPEVFAAHLQEPAPRIESACPAAGPQLGLAIMRCLEKNPQDRFPDADSFEHALAESPFVGHWTDERAEAWWQHISCAETSEWK